MSESPGPLSKFRAASSTEDLTPPAPERIRGEDPDAVGVWVQCWRAFNPSRSDAKPIAAVRCRVNQHRLGEVRVLGGHPVLGLINTTGTIDTFVALGDDAPPSLTAAAGDTPPTSLCPVHPADSAQQVAAVARQWSTLRTIEV